MLTRHSNRLISRNQIPSIRRVSRSRVSQPVVAASSAVVNQAPPIDLSEKALAHLKKLQADKQIAGQSLLMRVGIRQGGCSGLSYNMDFESRENIKEDDYVINYDDGEFQIVCDPKSLLYLFGMKLDYSDALIGGGFQFHNPNATDSCGCGKSFAV